jgi:succinyl-CoA synthetase alpha subunit
MQKRWLVLKLLNSKTVIVQGITGSHGSFHAKAMLDYGTKIVAGTSPNKAGESIHGLPVYGSIKDIIINMGEIDASVIFVPARFAKSAILEAIDANMPLIVCVTEGIPVHDMLIINNRLSKSNSQLIGPNSPGVIIPGETKLGIIPAQITTPGSVAIVSRSGTLTYEAVAGLSSSGIGQKYVIGIGGDPVGGTSFVDCLKLFENDPEVSSIVLIGEIGGESEITAANFIRHNITKPVVAYIAGRYAPENIQLGHAGAILGSKKESATSKSEYLNKAGVTVVDDITEVASAVAKIDQKKGYVK